MTTRDEITDLTGQIRGQVGDWLTALDQLEEITLGFVPESFTYDQLGDEAKAKVQEVNAWYAWNDGSANENCHEAAKYMFEQIGLELEECHYALYSRGGEPTFLAEGTIGLDFHVQVGHSCVVNWWVGDRYAEEGDDNWSQPEEGARFIRELMPAMRNAVSKMLYAEDDYVSGDEYAKEMAEANDYRYDENGNIV